VKKSMITANISRLSTTSAIAFAVIATFNMIPTAEAATYPQAKSIYMNGTLLSTPYGLVSGGTTYMPIWYVIQALNQLGITNSWDGVHTAWTISAPSDIPVDLTNVPNSTGANTISLNGKKIYNVNRLVYTDPSSHAATSYMPIWYIMQLLNRLEIGSTWNGSTWKITTPPLFPPPSTSPSSAPLPPASSASSGKKTILSWATDGNSIIVAEQNSTITQINNDNYNINADGTVTDSTEGSNTLSQLYNYGQSHNVDVFATVTNISPTTGDFDGTYTSLVLNNRTTRSDLEKNLINIAVQDGYAGIDLDLENLNPTDQAIFTQFLSELAIQLHAANKHLSVTVPAETGPTSEPWEGAYNYAAIGNIADIVTVMAYDFSWQASTPGPIAPLYWDEQILKYATLVMPTSKILLGLAAYGYDWNTTTVGLATGFSLNKIDSMITQYHVIPSWDSTDSAPYFTYTDAGGNSHTVYYENQASIEPKLNLASQFGVAGVAIWHAGSENQAFLNAVQAWLRTSLLP